MSVVPFQYRVIRRGPFHTTSIISINSAGEVIVKVPSWVPTWEIDHFVQSKSDWISRKLSLFHRRPKSSPKKFIDGELHPFFGEEFPLKITKISFINRCRLKFFDQVFQAVVPSDHSPRQQKLDLQKLLLKLYLEHGKRVINEKVYFYSKKLGVVYNRITLKNVSAKNIGLTTSTIQYTSKDASKVKIYYGTSTSFGGAKEVSTSTTETTYTTELTGLSDGTKYYYKINTFDSDGSEYEGTILDFTTLPRPKITNVLIQQVANTAQSTILVSWNTNTEVSSIVTYYPESTPPDARDEVNVALVKGEHRMIIRSLLPQTDYILVVKGRDRIGNEAASDSQRLTTATDTRPPQISDLHVEGDNIPQITGAGQEQSAQLIISWNTDEPATSQVEFGEGTGANYSSKTQEDSNLTINHIVIISALTPSKVYHIRALSKDKADNVGRSIDSVTITPKATDNALNLVITNLQSAFGFLGGLDN